MEEMWESERSLENWGEAQTVKKGFPLRNKLTPQDPRKKSDVVVHAQSITGTLETSRFLAGRFQAKEQHLRFSSGFCM